MKKCGYVALIGAPNAGKSTLANALTGNRISIVTAKPQTTRGRVRAIAGAGETQIIFIDTPGIFEASPKFEKAMVDAAWSGVDDSDAIVLVVDAARGLDDDTRQIIGTLKKRQRKAVLVLNKVDKSSNKQRLPELAASLYAMLDFERSFMVSAERGDGIADIMGYLATLMPPGEWLYPDDEITDMKEREIASEITREQCFTRLHAELPYSLMVDTEKWEEKPIKGRRTIKINQQVIVERESQKKILLGSGGKMLKAIGSSARRKIGELLDAEVHLFLFVKVQEKWKSDPGSFHAAGLEYKD